MKSIRNPAEAATGNRRKTRRARLWCFIGAACFSLSAANGQQLDPSESPGDPPEFVDVFAGWDFAGMTDDEIAGFSGIANPLTQEGIDQGLTPEQRDVRDAALLDITQPSTVPPVQTPEAQLALYAITHSTEYQHLLDGEKTRPQLEQDAVARWLILHPVEAAQMTQSLMTPDQIKARILAQIEAANPELKPKPIMVTVPFLQASEVLTNAKSKD